MDHAHDPNTLHVVSISAQADDRWRLSDQYVEEVWSEHLGPTATLLARRFGRMIVEHPGGVDIDLADLAAGVGVQPGVAIKALGRLHRFELVYFSAEQSLVGVSGFAPSVKGPRVLRLSQRGRLVHDRLVAASEVARPAPPDPAVQPVAGRLSERRRASSPGRSL